jgi:hypothetical protein
LLDGNGRVARLMSHAMLLDLGVGSALWSISRGLARSSSEYKLKTFDYVAADPPFSDKRWSTGLDPLNGSVSRRMVTGFKGVQTGFWRRGLSDAPGRLRSLDGRPTEN